MPMNPTKYEYAAPVQVAGMAKDFTTKVEIAQTPQGWIATVQINSSPLSNVAEAQTKLRAELLKIAELLQTGMK
jgi:hypothetical protein